MVSHSINSQANLVEQYSSATVIGLGVTGYSVARYLLSRGFHVTVMDSRALPPLASEFKREFPKVETIFGAFDPEAVIADDLIVASPGVSLKEPLLREAKRNGAHIVGDIELFLQENTQPVIAVTGSNGKSTVVTLVGEMCQDNGLTTLVAGNIGKPALDALTDGRQYDIAVLELSSFQLETTYQVPAQSAAILNISADHMDRYDSMGDYVLAKARILRGAQRAILPSHDEWLQQITNANKVTNFELEQPANDADFGMVRKSNGRWLTKGDNKLMRVRDIPLIGLHNVKNVLSAFALVDFLNLPLEGLVETVKKFKGLAHRMQTVVKNRGVLWVNDSKATNIGATSTALSSLEESVIWIAGGQGKGADFNELRHSVSGNVKQLILIGEDAGKIEKALNGLLPITCSRDLAAAVDVAADAAVRGDVVLFSPACASFDMYQNFERRGEAFIECVERKLVRGAS